MKDVFYNEHIRHIRNFDQYYKDGHNVLNGNYQFLIFHHQIEFLNQGTF